MQRVAKSENPAFLATRFLYVRKMCEHSRGERGRLAIAGMIGNGSPKFAMISTLAGAAVNIILNPIFIFGFRWVCAVFCLRFHW